MKISETQQKILEVGKREFLGKGFKDASLRKIAAKAGFTKGAFYGYYPDKAALFEALVSEAADGLTEQFRAAQDAHFDLIILKNSSLYFAVLRAQNTQIIFTNL